MAEGCAGCKYMQLCIFLEYPLVCENKDECEHYDAFMDGEEEYES